ncbi:MAG: hypothetical protein QOG43_312, partial [Actinomycetota bacterium]|nr:hypothetical protein [Actinomycetota bacterium]
MSNWGDGLSEKAKTEMDQILSVAIAFAEKMLEGQGAFYPFAVKLTDAGETEMVTAPAGAEDPLAALTENLAGQRFELRAAAVAAAMHLQSLESDAVRVDLEHRDGAALTLIRPYTRTKLRKKV